jgi:phage FluMu protein Com
MIKFNCKKCGQKLSVPETRAGKKGKCPRCKNIIVVPAIQTSDNSTNQMDSGACEDSSKSSSYDSALLDIRKKDKVQELVLKNTETSESSVEHEQEFKEEDTEETTASRRLPWFIDIFLYPLSISGLVYLVICFCAPIVISLIWQFLLQQIWPIGELIIAIFYMLFVGYVMYYLSWCIIDSTKGGRRAPDITNQSSPKGELIQCAGILLACIVFCFWPVAVYYIFTEKTGLIYWMLAAIGLLFFPMALLSGFLHDSINGLNPVLITKSVIKTFNRYLPIVIFFAGFFIVLSVIIPPFPQSKNFKSISHYISEFIGNIFGSRYALRLTGFIYIAMIGAHILGRFYCECKERLNWEV